MGNFEPIDIFNDICNIALTQSLSRTWKVLYPEYLRHLAFFSVQASVQKFRPDHVELQWEHRQLLFFMSFLYNRFFDSRYPFLHVYC